MGVDEETVEEMGHVGKIVVSSLFSAPGRSMMTSQIVENVKQNTPDDWEDSVESVDFVVKSTLDLLEGDLVYRTEDGWSLHEEEQVDVELDIDTDVVRVDKDISDDEAKQQIEELEDKFFESMDESPESLVDIMETYAGDYSDDCMWIAFRQAQRRYLDEWGMMPPEWASEVESQFIESTDIRDEW